MNLYNHKCVLADFHTKKKPFLLRKYFLLIEQTRVGMVIDKRQNLTILRTQNNILKDTKVIKYAKSIICTFTA